MSRGTKVWDSRSNGGGLESPAAIELIRRLEQGETVTPDDVDAVIMKIMNAAYDRNGVYTQPAYVDCQEILRRTGNQSPFVRGYPTEVGGIPGRHLASHDEDLDRVHWFLDQAGNILNFSRIDKTILLQEIRPGASHSFYFNAQISTTGWLRKKSTFSVDTVTRHSSKEKAHSLRAGPLFDAAPSLLMRRGWNSVDQVLGTWRREDPDTALPSLNWIQFQQARSMGVEQAALSTWTGQQAANKGYQHVTFLNKDNHSINPDDVSEEPDVIIVLFRK